MSTSSRSTPGTTAASTTPPSTSSRTTSKLVRMNPTPTSPLAPPPCPPRPRPLAPPDPLTIESRPIAPTEVTASVAGHLPAMTKLTWKDNSQREIGYRIEYQVGTIFGGGGVAWGVLPNAGN